MTPMRRVAVFCGSNSGTDPAWRDAAYSVGRGLAERDLGLVYGGGGSGLMQAVSQGALDGGGEVIGVIPEVMVAREWARNDLTELIRTQTMHERKAKMAELADAFLCLPGGLGTIEEIVEVWSWRQLGFNNDPVCFFNSENFWAPLITFFSRMVDVGFLAQAVMDDVVVTDNLDDALAGLESQRGVRLPPKLGPADNCFGDPRGR